VSKKEKAVKFHQLKTTFPFLFFMAFVVKPLKYHPGAPGFHNFEFLTVFSCLKAVFSFALCTLRFLRIQNPPTRYEILKIRQSFTADGQPTSDYFVSFITPLWLYIYKTTKNNLKIPEKTA